MTDVLTPAQRSFNMSRIRGKDTAPEMQVRRLVWSLGYRYRLHGKTLPGKPDIVFSARKKVILVHGCFWHRHSCKNGRTTPLSRASFWQAKFEGNVARDKRNRTALRRLGWKALVVWECELSKPEKVRAKLLRFLKD